mgnify:CR=1 FL=1
MLRVTSIILICAVIVALSVVFYSDSDEPISAAEQRDFPAAAAPATRQRDKHDDNMTDDVDTTGAITKRVSNSDFAKKQVLPGEPDEKEGRATRFSSKFDAEFDSEERDTAWANQTEQDITAAIHTQQYLDTYQITDIACKKTLCKVVANKASELVYQDRQIPEAQWNYILHNGLKQMIQTSLNPAATRMDSSHSDYSEFTFYLRRADRERLP